MKRADESARARSKGQRYLITRPQILEDGVDRHVIQRRLAGGEWMAVQAGVYQLDIRVPVWRDQLLAAILAGGSGAVASHRAALVLWDLDGLSTAPVELSVPHSHGPTPSDTVLHRTRRPPESTIIDEIPVTTVERTLLDSCSLLGPMIMTKATESAFRKRLTTEEGMWEFLKCSGGRGVKGTRLLRRILQARDHETATGSASETEAWYHMRSSDLPTPELQREFTALDGARIRPDFYWPALNKAVEIDGIDAHDSADKLDHDLQRQNRLMDLGIDLRRFSARLVRRDPERFLRDLRDFLSR